MPVSCAACVLASRNSLGSRPIQHAAFSSQYILSEFSPALIGFYPALVCFRWSLSRPSPLCCVPFAAYVVDTNAVKLPFLSSLFAPARSRRAVSKRQARLTAKQIVALLLGTEPDDDSAEDLAPARADRSVSARLRHHLLLSPRLQTGPTYLTRRA